MQFTHLRVASSYSLQYGTTPPATLVARAAEQIEHYRRVNRVLCDAEHEGVSRNGGRNREDRQRDQAQGRIPGKA